MPFFELSKLPLHLISLRVCVKMRITFVCDEVLATTVQSYTSTIQVKAALLRRIFVRPWAYWWAFRLSCLLVWRVKFYLWHWALSKAAHCLYRELGLDGKVKGQKVSSAVYFHCFSRYMWSTSGSSASVLSGYTVIQRENIRIIKRQRIFERLGDLSMQDKLGEGRTTTGGKPLQQKCLGPITSRTRSVLLCTLWI